MNVLGLSLGILSTTALLKNNKIVACVSEERFSRLKNDESFPLQAIDYVLAEGGLEGAELDAVVIAGHNLNLNTHLMRKYSKWSISEQFAIMKNYWKPKLLEGKKPNFNKIFQNKIDIEQYPGPEQWNELLENVSGGYNDDKDEEIYRDFIHRLVAEYLNIDRDKILHLDHHDCHAAYAYWASPVRGRETLVITADAFGDGLSTTLSTVDSESSLVRRHAVKANDFQLGRIYRSMTLALGMMPDAHEFKVMGLAPYAKEKTLQRAYEVFKKGMYVDGLDFKYNERPSDLFFYYKEQLEECRFDGIAGGLQKYTEEILLEYVANAMKHFDCSQLVFSGGISMNVKANMLIKDLSCIDNMFVPPSGGDESLAIGACYAYMDQIQKIVIYFH